MHIFIHGENAKKEAGIKTGGKMQLVNMSRVLNFKLSFFTQAEIMLSNNEVCIMTSRLLFWVRSQSPNRLPVYHDKKENGPCDDSVLTSDVLFAVAFGLTLVNHFSFSAAEVQLPAASR